MAEKIVVTIQDHPRTEVRTVTERGLSAYEIAIQQGYVGTVGDWLISLGSLASPDHGALAGLADDDHTLYHTDARGDARYSALGHAHGDIYYTEAETDALLGGKAASGHNHSGVYEPTLGNPGVTGYVLTSTDAGVRSWVAGGGGGVTDHGALTGLADDDHSQYHNDARGDARYPLLAHTHASLVSGTTTATVSADLLALDTPGNWSTIVAEGTIGGSLEFYGAATEWVGGVWGDSVLDELWLSGGTNIDLILETNGTGIMLVRPNAVESLRIEQNLVTVTRTLNVAPTAGDEPTPANGDLWYNSTTGKFMARQAGASVEVLYTAPSVYNQTIEDEAIAVTQRSTINFTGAGVAVTDVGGKTTITIAGGGGGGDVYLAGTQTFTGENTFQGDVIVDVGWNTYLEGLFVNQGAIFYDAFELNGTTAPILKIKLHDMTPSAADLIGEIFFESRDSATNIQVYSKIQGRIIDPTSTSEDGNLHFITAQAGALATRLEIAAGLIVGIPTGGDQGTGTVNATQMYLNGTALKNVGVEVEASATQTLALDDAGKFMVNTTGSLHTVTVPPNVDVALAVGTELGFTCQSTGQILLAQGAGVTITSISSHKRVKASGGGAYLVKTATNTWSLLGDLEA